MAAEEPQGQEVELLFKRTAVAPIRVQWMCNKFECKGEMQLTGRTTMTWPSSYEHRCDACGQMGYNKTAYPTIEYV
jgi:hypothetical protein